MILIVEDDPQVARLIALVLQRSGFKTETVADGHSALQRTRELRPALVFADLSIHGMGGDALCSTLKADPGTRAIPFVVLSGDPDIAEKARACGADDHLGKPFEFDDLVRIVKQHAADPSR